MTCGHLIQLERAIAAAGIEETFRGAPWAKDCREWVYFDCILPAAELREAFALADCVRDHAHLGTHDGQESGFVCEIHKDAVMGHHPDAQPGARRFAAPMHGPAAARAGAGGG
jgi:hypothetical protein